MRKLPTGTAAVRKADGELVPQPSADVVLEPGDVVIAMGTAATMDRLEALFAPQAAVGSRGAPS
jgi:K+/H+ antiporter YhaU regulatory subunit KhtT